MILPHEYAAAPLSPIHSAACTHMNLLQPVGPVSDVRRVKSERNQPPFIDVDRNVCKSTISLL